MFGVKQALEPKRERKNTHECIPVYTIPTPSWHDIIYIRGGTTKPTHFTYIRVAVSSFITPCNPFGGETSLFFFVFFSPSHVLSSPFCSLSLLVNQIRGHAADSSLSSPLQFVPCIFIARRFQPLVYKLSTNGDHIIGSTRSSPDSLLRYGRRPRCNARSYTKIGTC